MATTNTMIYHIVNSQEDYIYLRRQKWMWFKLITPTNLMWTIWSQKFLERLAIRNNTWRESSVLICLHDKVFFLQNVLVVEIFFTSPCFTTTTTIYVKRRFKQFSFVLNKIEQKFPNFFFHSFLSFFSFFFFDSIKLNHLD